jgi:hypothetical protein
VGSSAGVGSISVMGVMVADDSMWGVSEVAEATHPARRKVVLIRVIALRHNLVNIVPSSKNYVVFIADRIIDDHVTI